MNEFLPLLPLIVPSFSSKGNLMIKDEQNNKIVSDNYGLLISLDIKLSRTYLLSAYDIYYGFMPQNPEMWPESEYLFIDSGGYEINDSFDMSERNKYNYKVLPWDKEKMEKVYRIVYESQKHKSCNMVFSCFDSYEDFQVQIDNANNLSSRFPRAKINCIIKCLDIRELIRSISEGVVSLNGIAILGVTEKELGLTVYQRVINLIDLKDALLEKGWNGYIHIFGGLEPNLINLYYWAGADIFDGLAWQRYWLRDDTFLFSPQKYNARLDEFQNKYIMMCDNLAFLQSLCTDLSANVASRNDQRQIIKERLSIAGDLMIQDILNMLEV